MNDHSYNNASPESSPEVNSISAAINAGRLATARSTPLPAPSTEEKDLTRAALGGWTYPAASPTMKPVALKGRKTSRRRKRRIYADYRQLISLESQAKKLNFLSPYVTRSTPSEPTAPGLQQPEFLFKEAPGAEGANRIPGMPAIELAATARNFSGQEQQAMLIVDQRMSMFFGSGRNLKSVVAANAAALLAWRMLAQCRQFGAMIFNDKRIVQMRPGCSRLQTLLFLQTVLNQNHGLQANAGICSNPIMLNDALRRASKLSGTPLIFLITDASGHDGETLRVSSEISQHSDLVVVLVYDPRQAKAGRGTTRQQLMASQLFSEGVPVIPINTRNDVAYQLRHSYIKAALSSFAKMRSTRTASVPSMDAPRV